MEAVVKLNRKLGVGGRGVVYEGFDHARGHFVAIKELAYMEPSVADEDDTELAAILSELAYMREAQHTNLVEYYGARRCAIGIQIIMEYVSGGSLDYVLTRCGPLRENVARAYTRDVLEALHYLHKTMHVCHRDVKPANILITPDGRCKLADFGVAKQVDATTPTRPAHAERGGKGMGKEEEGNSPRHRNGGRQGYLQTAVGTPWYMAPEVINGGVEDDDDGDEDLELGNACAVAIDGDANSGSFSEDWTSSGLAHTVPDASASPPPLYSSSSYYNPLKSIVKKGRLGARSVGYTTSADIWSVGVTVYEMVTGTKPFGADLTNPSAVLFRIANCAASPPQLPADVHVSAELHSFLDLCFVYDKDLRATAAELLGHPWLGPVRKGGGSGGDNASADEKPRRQLFNGKRHSRSGMRVDEGEQVQRHQQLAAQRTVFDGVPLLDSIDLPAYPATTAVSSPPSSAVAECGGSGEGAHPAPDTSPRRARHSVHRLSCSGTHCSGCSVTRRSPSTISPPLSSVSIAEQAEASSRYAAVRQRIGHTRATNSAHTAASAAPLAAQSNPGSLFSTRGEFVDFMSHP
ncbi:Protein kinase (STE family) [Leishmania donovani]|uniref:Protein_kinase_putative/GeneDB:LmjF.25.1990 n=1 Tax=Leishmania donovani TaxID=5661 RepID=A0A6J8FCB8_LEIDO|nr:Protein kinase (STE family) [Leishmania donovani]VDZ45400.1 protein_kinase_putative/GeneDB:LmjF.25.1990 [Leishmania donovani]